MKKKPNILFLMDDEHRADALGCAGNPSIRTPNLDRLAAEGAMFTRAYASVPSCLASRAAILTGLSPWNHGLLGFAEQSTRWPLVAPRAMNEAGYLTHAIGKNHFWPWQNTHGYAGVERHEGLPRTEGIDDYGLWLAQVAPGASDHATGLSWNDRRGAVWPFKTEFHPTAWTGQRAVDFLNGYASDQPFFLKVSFHRPHPPYDPPTHWWEHYAHAELPPAYAGAWAQRWFGKFTSPEPPEEPRARLPAAQVRNSRQGYYGAISFVDEQIGRIMDTLRARELIDNTLIVFVSDHGEMLGDHHLWRKTYAYEASSRVPLIVRWGENVLTARRGRRLPHLAELRDLLPTFLDAAGSAPTNALNGLSLLAPIRGETDTRWRTQLDLEHSACYWVESAWTGLTDGRFKYIYWSYTGRQQLFDLENDPTELHDLADDPSHANLLAAWRRKMIAHLAPRGEQWVKDGDLAQRAEPIHRSPNFPDKTVPLGDVSMPIPEMDPLIDRAGERLSREIRTMS